MCYREYHTRRIGVAYCDPVDRDPASIAEAFTELVRTNLEDGAELDTIAQWATHGAHYGRIALADQEVQREGWAALKQLGGVQ